MHFLYVIGSSDGDSVFIIELKYSKVFVDNNKNGNIINSQSHLDWLKI